MKLILDLHQLERNSLELEGEISAEKLEITEIDECIKVTLPIKYKLTAQKVNREIFIQGEVQAWLDCECVRCLKSFQQPIHWPNWDKVLSLDGEDRVIAKDDCVDLTPILREDILLDCPQHPLCDPGCDRLPQAPGRGINVCKGPEVALNESSAWTELNKLRLEE
jgi:uncharacterized protein